MDGSERTMLYGIAFYVFIDALGKVFDFIARLAG
jgi:hypothetical protein